MTPINSINLNEQNETRLLVVEMSHDEVYFNVFFFIIFGKLSFCVQSDGQEISTKILISWQELKNRQNRLGKLR